MDDDGFVVLGFVLVCALLCGISSTAGYTLGYDAHRRDVCERSGGTWMQLVHDERKRTCIGGRR